LATCKNSNPLFIEYIGIEKSIYITVSESLNKFTTDLSKMPVHIKFFLHKRNPA